jgi:hypothetical protein
MADPRLEPRLERELARLEAAGQESALVQVVIEHARRATASTPDEPGGDPREQAARLAKQSYVLGPIMARLTALGAREFSPLPLATAVSAALTARQVRAIAAHPDVRLVHLAEPEIVTT